jgi:hypothetical protein
MSARLRRERKTFPASKNSRAVSGATTSQDRIYRINWMEEFLVLNSIPQIPLILSGSSSNPGALEERAQDFLGFEKFVGNFAGGKGMAGKVGIDHPDSFGNFA